MNLSIILVNYKSAALIIDCVNSIYAQRHSLNFEILVIDNSPETNDSKTIAAAFPEIRIASMDYNAGFARANNKGINLSTGEVVLLLNSDTIIEDNAIDRCYNMLSSSHYVASGVQLLNPDGSPQISGNYFMKGSLNNLLPLPYLGGFFKTIANFLKVKKPNVPDATGTVEVDWINGAFLMVKREVISKAGLLDEDFFLYAEEAEWCYRISKYGKLCIFGDLKIIHLQGETANETFASSTKGYQNLYDRKGLQIMISNLVRIKKQFGSGWFLFHLFIYTADIPVFFLGLLLENIFKLKNPFRYFSRLSGFINNVFYIWRFAGKIISNKPWFYKVL